MIDTKLVETAQAVIDACNAFLETQVTKPARVQEREMRAVVAKLQQLAPHLDVKDPQFCIGTFHIDKAGQRTDPAKGGAHGIAHLVYLPAKDEFGAFWTTLPVEVDGVVGMVPLLPGIRSISLAELVEMGFSIAESVEFIKKLAEHLSFEAYAKAATGPVGSA